MVGNLLRRNNTDAAPTSIVHQREEHLASKLLGYGFEPAVSEEFVDVATIIVGVELGGDAFEKGCMRAARYGSPPLVGDSGTSESDYQAPSVVITNLGRMYTTARPAMSEMPISRLRDHIHCVYMHKTQSCLKYVDE